MVESGNHSCSPGTGILVDLVTKGMGVALLMKQLALYAAAPDTKIVDLSPCIATQIYLCYLKGIE